MERLYKYKTAYTRVGVSLIKYDCYRTQLSVNGEPSVNVVKMTFTKKDFSPCEIALTSFTHLRYLNG